MFKISFLPKYRVKYYDYIVKWCSGVTCECCVSLDIALTLALSTIYWHYLTAIQTYVYSTCMKVKYALTRYRHALFKSNVFLSHSSYVVPSTCSKHDNRPIEYFCEDDNVAICSHCVIMGEHREHAITAMEEKVRVITVILCQ